MRGSTAGSASHRTTRAALLTSAAASMASPSRQLISSAASMMQASFLFSAFSLHCLGLVQYSAIQCSSPPVLCAVLVQYSAAHLQSCAQSWCNTVQLTSSPVCSLGAIQCSSSPALCALQQLLAEGLSTSTFSNIAAGYTHAGAGQPSTPN